MKRGTICNRDAGNAGLGKHQGHRGERKSHYHRYTKSCSSYFLIRWHSLFLVGGI